MNPHGVHATTVSPTLLAAFNTGVALARAAAEERACEVTVYTNDAYAREHVCGQPTSRGALFCDRHEAARIRLMCERTAS